MTGRVKLSMQRSVSLDQILGAGQSGEQGGGEVRCQEQPDARSMVHRGGLSRGGGGLVTTTSREGRLLSKRAERSPEGLKPLPDRISLEIGRKTWHWRDCTREEDRQDHLAEGLLGTAELQMGLADLDGVAIDSVGCQGIDGLAQGLLRGCEVVHKSFSETGLSLSSPDVSPNTLIPND